MIYYSAGTVPLSKLYNIEAHREVQTSVVGSPFPVAGGAMPFNHTPVFVPLLHLLVDDNYAASYFRWTSLLWLAAFGCAFVIFKMSRDVALAFAAGSFYPLFTYVQQAHDSVFMLLGILVCAHLLSQGKDLLAGIALSLSTLKPQFAIFLAIPFIARPKAFLGFCAGAAALTLYSILLIGPKGVLEYSTLLRISAGGQVFGVRPLAMVNLLGLMERAGVSPYVARPVAWAVFFLSAIFLVAVWRRSRLTPPLPLTILLAVFTSPHLYGHDLALLLVSFATLSKSYALLALVSSVTLVASTIISSPLQFVVAYPLMGALLALSAKDAFHVSLAKS